MKGQKLQISEAVSETATCPISTSSRRKQLLLGQARPRIKIDVPRHESGIHVGLLNNLQKLAAGLLDWPLFLYGKTGCGKTCAALWLMDQVRSSVYVTMEQLIKDAWTKDKWFPYCKPDHADLLIVDEIGARSFDSDREYVALKEVSDLREHCPAIYISNISAADIQKQYDDRIFSRLCCGTIVYLKGKDRRFL